MPLSTEIRNQIAAGQCQQGSCENCCLLRDGTEASCYTIRECSPSLHVEYALPGATPNTNIWVLGEGGFVWNGPAPQPSTPPVLTRDPFSGGLSFAPDLSQLFNVTLPPPVQGGGQRGQAVIPPGAGAANANAPGAGGAIAASFAPGLLGQLQRYLQSTVATLNVSQPVFCRAYSLATGFPCDFAATDNEIRGVDVWLSRLQSDQDARIATLGGRANYRGTGGNPPPPVPYRPNPGGVYVPMANGGGNNNMLMFAALAVLAVAVLIRR